MKYLCESCERLVEAARFRLEGPELVLSCSKCGAETRARSGEAEAQPKVAAASAPAQALAPAPASAPAAPPPARVVPLHAVPPPTFAGEDPFAVPDDRCPKCVAHRPESALTCRQCGLVFANFVVSEHEPSKELRQAWSELVARWDDLGAHDRVLAGATARGELAGAGRLYRIRLARQPKDPIAQRGRDEVLRLAASTSPLVPERPLGVPSVSERSRQVLLLGVLAFMAVGIVWLLVRLFSFSPPPP